MLVASLSKDQQGRIASYHALRADNPTNRQRSMATVFINEASFEELVNAHTEGPFT